jgi:hypothetical protein
MIHNLQADNLKKVKIQAVSSIINYAKGLISDDDIDINEPLGQYAD